MLPVILVDNCPLVNDGSFYAGQLYRYEREVKSLHKETKRPLRADAMHHRTVILKTARDLFSKNGIDQVSMHQIAKTAGVGQGTLYRRYAHKGELCLDLLLDTADKNCDEISNYLQKHQDDPIEVRLDKALAYSLDFIEEQCRWLSAIKAPSCEDHQTLIYHSPLYKSRHKLFRELLAEVPGRNDCQPLDTTFIADLIMAGIAPNLFLFLRDDRGYTKDEIREKLYNLYFRPLFS